MAWRWYVWVLMFLIIMVIGLIGLVFYQNIELSLSSVELEDCGVLENNGEDKIDIVFFGEKDESERYMEYFLDFKPMNGFRNDFNFFYIDSYKPECDLYRGIAILCYSRELIRKASSCPNDYIIVLEERDLSLRSSSYVNVMSINTRHPMSVLAHEFGHVFANFAEEYSPANIPRGALNCPAKCSGFGGEENGCFSGCSENNHIRSIDNGVMRTLRSEDFGNFDDGVLIERIEEEIKLGDDRVSNSPVFYRGGISGRAVHENGEVDCTPEEYYLIGGVFEDEGIEINSRRIESGCVGGNGYGGFDYDLVLQDGEILDGGAFDPEMIFTSAPDSDEDGVLEGGVFVGDGEFYLKIPIVGDSKVLEISIDGELLSSVDLYDIGGRACLV